MEKKKKSCNFIFGYAAVFLLITECWCAVSSNFGKVTYKRDQCRWEVNGTLKVPLDHKTDLVSYQVGVYQLCTLRLSLADCEQTSGQETCDCTAAPTDQEIVYNIMIVSKARGTQSHQKLVASMSVCDTSGSGTSGSGTSGSGTSGSSTSGSGRICRHSLDQEVAVLPGIRKKLKIKPRCSLNGAIIPPTTAYLSHELPGVPVNQKASLECCAIDSVGPIVTTLSMNGDQLFVTNDNCLWVELRLNRGKNLVEFRVTETICEHKETFAYGIVGLKEVDQSQGRRKVPQDDYDPRVSDKKLKETAVGIGLLVLSVLAVGTAIIIYSNRKRALQSRSEASDYHGNDDTEIEESVEYTDSAELVVELEEYSSM